MLQTRYRTGPIRTTWRAKPGGGRRRLAHLSAADAAVWHEVTGRLARLLEPLLDPRVVGNRAVLTVEGWRPESLDTALERGRQIGAGVRGRALHTDVADFYASIRPEVAARAALQAGAAEYDARLVAEMLEGWTVQGHPGLPVGPPGSGVLANAVLRPVDAMLGRRPFVRWVDDYRIAVASDEDSAGVLRRLDAALGTLGLRRSERKTRMHAPGEISGVWAPSPLGVK